METKSIGFIGGGRITKIFLQAFQNTETSFPTIVVYDINENILKSLKDQFPFIKTELTLNLATRQDVIFIALYPPVIMETLEQIKIGITLNSIVISLAPKINIEKIANKLGCQNIARMIPNATSYINEGVNPICFASSFDPSEKRSTTEILQKLGKTFEVEESKLESYALISAMLPTYFWFQWKELQQLAKEMTLNEVETNDAIKETLMGAIHLFFDSKLSADEVIDLIPVKPIGDKEREINTIYSEKLLPLYQKIKP